MKISAGEKNQGRRNKAVCIRILIKFPKVVCIRIPIKFPMVVCIRILIEFPKVVCIRILIEFPPASLTLERSCRKI